jgi:hypothetical protein
VSLSITELSLIAELLEMAHDQFSNHCCNDYEIKNSKEHKNLLIEMVKWNVNQKIDKNARDEINDIENNKHKMLDTANTSLMSFLANRCREELKD